MPFSAMTKSLRTLLLMSLCASCAWTGRAVPMVLTYQGHLQDASGAVQSSGFFKFSLVDGAGRVLWHQDNTSLTAVEPATSVQAPLNRGLFSVALGGVGMRPLTASIFTNESVVLRVWAGTNSAKLERLSPDRSIGAVAYAVAAETATRAESARTADGVAEGAVGERQLQPALLSRLTAADSAFTAASNALNGRITLTSNVLSGQVALVQSSAASLSNTLSVQLSSLNTLAQAELNAERAARASALLKVVADLLSGSNVWSGSNFIAGPLVARNTSNLFQGEFTGKFVGDASGLTTLPSTSIAGVLPIENVPGLDASKIVSGQLPPARISSFDASKISSGTLSPERVPDLDGAKITKGTLADAVLGTAVVRRPELLVVSNALTVASNTVSARIESVNSTLTGSLTSEKADRILALAQALKDLLTGNNEWTGRNVHPGALIATNAANVFQGNGRGLTQLAASNLVGTVTQATVPAERVNGVLSTNNIPGLDGSKITTGLVAEERISEQIARVPVMLALHKGLDDRVTTLSNRIEAPNQSAAPFVSSDPADASLLGKGLQMFLTIPAPAWTAGTSANAPSARYAHSAVWTGSEFIIWGGNFSVQNFSDSGARYKADVDTWQSLSPLDAPSGRSGHTAVWTGTEMIIWGGFATNSALNNGARYNPTSGKWTPLPTANAPSAREGHIAVWTGKRMVIWGGDGGSGKLNTGAVYDPGSNLWTELTLTSPPTARSGARAVWAGDRVFIWGGIGETGQLNTGGELFFDVKDAPNRWDSVPVTGAPNARASHALVWTGSRILVWGGDVNSTYLNSGAQFDPSTRTWTTMATTDAPSARGQMAHFWSGKELVVVGGEDSTGALSNSFGYDPISNKWRAFSTSGSPLPRIGGTATWSGSEILVFGGKASGSAVGSLQRLNPQPAWYFYRKP